jgi:hypothetical protein
MSLMFLFLLLNLAVIITPATAITCLSSTGAYITPGPNDRCVECELRGPLIAPGVCQYLEGISNTTTTTQTNTGFIATTCPLTYDGKVQCHGKNGHCYPSQFGMRCSECNNDGFLQLTPDLAHLNCSCYLHSLDSRGGCTLNPLSPQLFQSTVIQIEYSKLYCESFKDTTTYGCFASVDSTGHRYGDPNPPVPNQCCSEIYGPPPGELMENLFVDEIVTQYEDCTRFGTTDPNDIGKNFKGFRTCSNHGTWNTTTRTCTCWEGWDLGLIGEDIDGNDVYSCVACAPYYGPDSYDPSENPPYCSKIWTPDPFTGIESECGARGKYIPGEGCSCYSNSTIGYWTRTNLTFDGFTVETCSSCAANVTKPYPYCL